MYEMKDDLCGILLTEGQIEKLVKKVASEIEPSEAP